MKQKIYRGTQYDKGINGQHLLIVGHQIHATADELEKYTNMLDWDIHFIHDFCDQNNDLMGDVARGFKNTEGKEWDDNRKKNTHLKFARTILGDDYLSSDATSFKLFWKRIAFCNFLQVPDVDLGGGKVGKDKTYRYDAAKLTFKEYLYELQPQPNIIIVWGMNCYPYVVSMAKEIIDDRRCVLEFDKLEPIEVVGINHPSQASYARNRKLLALANLFPITDKY